MLWTYTILSVIIVSLISLIGIFALLLRQRVLDKIMVYFVSFSAGALLGDAFFHLIPDAYLRSETKMSVSAFVLFGILIFFVLEKFIHWRHCHKADCEGHPHTFSYLILAGDALHNFIDGLVIAASYLSSVPLGIATTFAVVFHEIPHEAGDYMLLLYGGLSKKRAMAFNFAGALTSIVGALIVLFIYSQAGSLVSFLIPFAAGGFVYVAGTDLIPELHKRVEVRESVLQFIALLGGMGLMAGLLFLE